LKWDGEKMKFTNIGANEELRIVSKDSFRVEDGHPHFEREYITSNAQATAAEYIRHTYRDGWALPAMP
jgi:hypothetical protein